MTLEERENDLFNRWRSSINATEDKFAKDGVADEKKFNSAKYKILFLAKETNGTGKNWDSRSYLRDGVFYRSTQYKKDKNNNHKLNKNGKKLIEHKKGYPIWRTFNNIYRWTNLFLNDIKDYKKFDKVPSHKEKDEIILGSPRINIFSQIGMMNLKKTTGKSTTKSDEFKKFIENNKEFIKEQIDFYRPDIVICCGKEVYKGYKKAMGETIEENKKNGEFKTSKYIGDGYETVVIDFYHPQVLGKLANTEIHFNLLKSIKEQYKL